MCSHLQSSQQRKKRTLASLAGSKDDNIFGGDLLMY